MFYDNYVRLCNSVGKTPSAVALEIGIAKPTVSRWKAGSKPNHATIIKVADYFNVSVSELTGEAQKKPPAQDGGAVDPARRELLDFARSADSEKLKAALDMLHILQQQWGDK